MQEMLRLFTIDCIIKDKKVFHLKMRIPLIDVAGIRVSFRANLRERVSEPDSEPVSEHYLRVSLRVSIISMS